jgi:hypothetical protein
VLAVIGLAWAAARYGRRVKALTVQRIALRALDALQNDPLLAPTEKAQQLSILLRRAALSAYPREEVAGLSGHEYLLWLERLLGDGRFIGGPGRVLSDLPYRPDPADGASLDALFTLCRDWLERLPPSGS